MSNKSEFLAETRNNSTAMNLFLSFMNMIHRIELWCLCELYIIKSLLVIISISTPLLCASKTFQRFRISSADMPTPTANKREKTKNFIKMLSFVKQLKTTTKKLRNRRKRCANSLNCGSLLSQPSVNYGPIRPGQIQRWLLLCKPVYGPIWV